MIVELDPRSNARLGLCTARPSMQIDALVFQRPPQAFDKDIVEEPTLAVHQDSGADPLRSISPYEGGELADLICVHNLGRAEPVDRLVQRFDAKVSLKGVRHAPSQNLAGVLVHDRHQK